MVLKEHKQSLYFSMILGTIGYILIAIIIMKYLVEETDTLGYGILLFGFVFTTMYTSNLEKTAGISKKFTLIRTIILMLSLIISALYFFYN